MNESIDDKLQELKGLLPLSKPQRRILGVLLEKAFTTPEYYPLTLKAVTTGCNQKSNRSPVTNYSEDEVADTLDGLRELGLLAVVHTESGRTERYRHYVRKQLSISEPQLAILTELLLRGRQQMGELRSRASRMVPIDSMEQLRQELEGLAKLNLVCSDAPLDRRGVNVDHLLYREGNHPATPSTPERKPTSQPPPLRAASGPAVESRAGVLATGDVSALQDGLEQLRLEVQELRGEVERLDERLSESSQQIDELRRDLGG